MNSLNLNQANQAIGGQPLAGESMVGGEQELLTSTSNSREIDSLVIKDKKGSGKNSVLRLTS